MVFRTSCLRSGCHVERSETSMICGTGLSSQRSEILRFAQNDRGPIRILHHLWARSEERCSCYGVAVITRDTSDAVPCFDFPVDDARRWYATGCKKAFWQIPFVPANRISVLAGEVLLLIHVAKVSPARARHCFQSA